MIRSTKILSEPHCRKCGELVDGAMHPSGATPTPGDLSICGYCGTLSRFTQELDIEPLEVDAIRDIKKNHPETYAELLRAQEVVRIMIKSKGSGLDEIQY